MKIIVHKQQSEVWDRRPYGKTFRFRDRAHTPYNKKNGEVEAIGTLQVYSHSEGAITIKVEELVTQPASGRVVGKVIDMDLIGEHAELLADYIKPGPVVTKDDLTMFSTLTALVKLKYGNLEPDVWDLIQRGEARLEELAAK
jgi:hypothetical protein